MSANSEILELHDIATLVNYERATTEPRFRHTKLRECSMDQEGQLSLSTVLIPQDILSRPVPVRGFVFDTVPGNRDDKDLPTNMLPQSRRHTSISKFNEGELEDIFWEVRGHDGCFKTIAILQEFFDLFPSSQALRIRTADGQDFVTTISERNILEYDLYLPSQTTLSIVFPRNMTYITGDQSVMNHAVWGFAKPGESIIKVSAILDLSSMQFGVNGRGKGGESFFLGSEDRFNLFLETVCGDVEPKKNSLRIRESPEDDWFRDVARRVKKRWDERETTPWCAHCGTPLAEPQRCPCKTTYYCGTTHQNLAWKFHKRYCATKAK